MERKKRRAPPAPPTPNQVCDLAWALAKKRGRGTKGMHDLIYWPFASPPGGDLRLFVDEANYFKRKARAILEERAIKRGWSPQTPPQEAPLPAGAYIPGPLPALKPEPKPELEPTKAGTPCRQTKSSQPPAKEQTAQRAAARLAEAERFIIGRRVPITPILPPPSGEKEIKKAAAKAAARIERRKARRFAPIPKPTLEQIRDRAHQLAREEGVTDKEILSLLHWPAWASPPLEPRLVLRMEWAEKLREKAKTILEEELAAQPRQKIKRIRKRKKPVLTRFWTRRNPLKHGQRPPPRRRNFLVSLSPLARCGTDPPGTALEESPAERPFERIREELLFYRGGGHRASVLRIRTRWNPLLKS